MTKCIRLARRGGTVPSARARQRAGGQPSPFVWPPLGGVGLVALLVCCAGEFPSASVPPDRCCREAFAPPAAGPEDIVFAQVGNVAVTEAQLFAYEGLARPGKEPVPLATLLAKVEDRVRFELLAQAAVERGLLTDPEVVEAARKTMVRRLLADDMGAARLGKNLPEDEIAGYYQRHLQDYQQPEVRRYAVLHFGRDAVGRTQADAFAAALTRGEDDAMALAAALRASVEGARATPLRVGTGAQAKRKVAKARRALRWEEQAFSSEQQIERRFGPDVAAAVFARPPRLLPPEILEGLEGPVAVKVLARRQAVARSLAQAREDIVEQLVRRQRAQLFERYLADIAERFSIAIYEDRMRAWLAPLPEAQGPAPAPAPVPTAAEVSPPLPTPKPAGGRP